MNTFVVKVTFFAPFLSLVPAKHVLFTFQRSIKVCELIHMLLIRYPNLKTMLTVNMEENIVNHMTVIIDDKLVQPNTIINKNLEVKIFGPISGG